MPAPPTEIRVKRKATDDPVELLRVQNEYNSLRQIRRYVFKRQRTLTASNNDILTPLSSLSLHAQQPAISFTESPSPIRTPQPADGILGDKGSSRPWSSSAVEVPNKSTVLATEQGSQNEIDNLLSKKPKTEPRRYHLARSLIPDPSQLITGHISDSKAPPAIFTERRCAAESHPQVVAASTPHELGLVPQNTRHIQNQNEVQRAQLSLVVDEERPPAPLRNVRLPSGKIIPWDADSEALALQMQAYALQEIGHNLEKASAAEISKASAPNIRARQVSSSKPKASALRCQDRNHEQASITEGAKVANEDETMTDAGETGRDDSDYVMDTYIRMPAEMFEYEEQKSVGLLVLDSQPDIDEFYNDDSDSDSDIYDEEEDENAENHPSTDYPEDEVDSDDEYVRGQHQRYQNRMPSVRAGCDEDDHTYSDDEARPSWTRRPWMINDAYQRNGGHEDDDN